jgi:hypothetical protein
MPYVREAHTRMGDALVNQQPYVLRTEIHPLFADAPVAQGQQAAYEQWLRCNDYVELEVTIGGIEVAVILPSAPVPASLQLAWLNPDVDVLSCPCLARSWAEYLTL